MENKKHILIADDDASIRSLLHTFLEGEGFEISEAKSGDEVLRSLTNGLKPDLIVMDYRMPGYNGLDVLQKMKDQDIEIPVLIMTALGTSSLAIKAIQMGAFDYITKPFDEIEDVLFTINRFFEYQDLSTEVKSLRGQLEKSREPADRMVGRSAKMLDLYKTIGRVARSDATVMITGETGTGKELLAEVIHYTSNYKLGPLVKVACAALPETLLESELFGHEKGAFTSAVTQRKGRFELANKGTIFLDEIGEMTLSTQKKLLRVLQEREFERVGGSTPIHIDVRVVAATNRDLQLEVANRSFREDLFYRLNVIHLHLPSLRERKDDIPLLVEHFLDKYRYTQSSPPARISDEAMEALMRHDWPGNIRELGNTIERAVVMAQGGVITSQHLLLSDNPQSRFVDVRELVRQKKELHDIIDEVGRMAIIEALEQSKGDRLEAANTLGLSRSELQEQMKSFKVPT